MSGPHKVVLTVSISPRDPLFHSLLATRISQEFTGKSQQSTNRTCYFINGEKEQRRQSVRLTGAEKGIA